MDTILIIESAEREIILEKTKQKISPWSFFKCMPLPNPLRNGIFAGFASRWAINYMTPEIPFSKPQT